MPARNYRHYLLGVLLVILAFNYVDRLALGLVLQNIKTDLHLTDTQLGLLSGLAFAVFYSVVGIPIARWADRGNRITIISLTTLLWSILVALCGAAATFTQLLLIRIGVAVGEAGCIPPAYSLIGDYFNRAERPRALAIYMLGGSLSMAIGYFLTGHLNERYGWRMTFALLGLPGLLLAALAAFTLKEPRRLIRVRGAATQSTDQPHIRDVCLTLAANKSFRHLLSCYAIASFFNNGIGQWVPSFFIRSHGMQTAELGAWLAAIYGLGGMAGTYLGGVLATRYAAQNETLQLKVMAAMYAAFGLVSMGIYLSPDWRLAFALLAVATIGGATAYGPLFAAIQTLVQERMRAIAIALLYLVANLIGMGLGPLAAGALSDSLRDRFDGDSLRYALLVLSPGYLWAAWHLWRASRTIGADLEAAQLA
jgi:MFS family permease